MMKRTAMEKACRGFLPVIALTLIAACRSPHPQISDSNFDAIVATPAFSDNGPKMLFDDAHNNFHRSDGRYAAFVTLARNDGFVVTSNTKPFELSSLKSHDILVIANAEGKTTGAPAFEAGEIEAVGSWVDNGGSLLLIADHSPFGSAANAMAERFGVSMLDAYVKDDMHRDPTLQNSFFLFFSRENGLLAEHPITRGKTVQDRVNRVVTFGGQALRVSSPVELLLRLSPDARIVKDPKQPSISEPTSTDMAHAVALTRGKGRVVIIGEAAALTAQVITGDAVKPLGVEELRFGMSRDDVDNKQFALNIIRWLARHL